MAKKIVHVRLFFWILVLQGVAMFMGLISGKDLVTWYNCLRKSSLTPPGVVFSIVWPILYVLLAIAGYRLYEKKSKQLTKGQIGYAIQLALNFLWTPVFFNGHWIGAAFVIVSLMVFFTYYLVIKCFKTDKVVSYLLIPYLLWIVFASYLNFYIFLNN